MRRQNPNDKCGCGSGFKFKKCCMPRGGLTKLEYDEEQAYFEKHQRERPKREAGFKQAAFPFFMMAMGYGGNAVPKHEPGWGRG